MTLKTSQIETGNGITTGFLQVLAEELSTDMSQMRYGMFNPASLDVVDTWVAVSSGGEGGSNAMSGTGPKIRNVGAIVYNALSNMASTNLGVPVANLTVKGGVVSGGGKTVSYGQLVGGKLLNLSGGNNSLAPGVAPAKQMSAYTTVTKDPNPVVRIDIPQKVTGEYTYVHNVKLPGMLHGRMVRPRGQGAYPYNSNVPVSVDATSISHIPGAKVVQVNNFLGVVAPKEYDAIQAAAQLKVVWNTNPILPGTGNLWAHYRQLDSAGKIAATVPTNKGNVDQALASSAHTVAGSFAHHYQGHMPIGPSCCVADVTAYNATIWSNTQNVYSLVPDLVNVLSPLQANQIRVLFYEGSGSFGNGCVAFDTAESAAIMSKAVGAPVRLQMMRWDEHGWTHYGPAILYDMRAGVDASGNMTAYEATGFSQGGTSLYTGRELLGAGPGSPIGDRQHPPDLGQRQRHGLGEPLAVDERREHELQVDQQADQLDDGHLPERSAPGSGRTADDVCRRSDDGHARGRREHGPARLPPPEHADRRDGSALVGGAPGGGDGGQLEAEGPRHEPRQGEHRHRTRHRQQPSRRGVRGGRGGHLGEQEVRQDQRDASLRGAGLGLRGQPRPDLQPDDRERHPGHEPCAVRRGHVQQEPGHEHRLGHLSDPPLRGCAEVTHVLVQRLDQPSLGSGEPVTCPCDRRNRERVLRRNGRAYARGAR